MTRGAWASSASWRRKKLKPSRSISQGRGQRPTIDDEREARVGRGMTKLLEEDARAVWTRV